MVSSSKIVFLDAVIYIFYDISKFYRNVSILFIYLILISVLKKFLYSFNGKKWYILFYCLPHSHKQKWINIGY